MDNSNETCLRCGSKRIVSGRLDNARGANFIPHGLRSFALSWTIPTICVPSDAYVCLDCGLLWTRVDMVQTAKVIDEWGKPELKREMEDKENAS